MRAELLKLPTRRNCQERDQNRWLYVVAADSSVAQAHCCTYPVTLVHTFRRNRRALDQHSIQVHCHVEGLHEQVRLSAVSGPSIPSLWPISRAVVAYQDFFRRKYSMVRHEPIPFLGSDTNCHVAVFLEGDTGTPSCRKGKFDSDRLQLPGSALLGRAIHY